MVTTARRRPTPDHRGDLFSPACPTRKLLDRIGTKWVSMVRDGLVARRVEDAVPPRVHYRLTELGLSLETPLAALREWAEVHMSEIDGHATGG